MKLIVEAGSSKTDSVVIATDSTTSPILQSPGINPVTDSNHVQAVFDLINQYKNQKIDSVHYYGSGCINESVNRQLANVLKSALEYDTNIEVNDDLIAVGRGLCQDNPGIVAILGTGSNAGYYDGDTIIHGIKSCGYLLGDEGSGYKLGQAIYLRLTRDLLPKDLGQQILADYNLHSNDLIPTLYNHQNPRQFLASFAIYVKKLPNDLRLDIAGEVFAPFLKNMIIPLLNRYNTAVHVSGSIAYHFEPELRDMLGKSDNIATSFEKSPLKGLIRYHNYE